MKSHTTAPVAAAQIAVTAEDASDRQAFEEVGVGLQSALERVGLCWSPEYE